MNRKKTWLIIIGFVVLIAGASVLYQYLGDEVESAPFGKIESTSASQEDEHSTEEQTDTQTNPHRILRWWMKTEKNINYRILKENRWYLTFGRAGVDRAKARCRTLRKPIKSIKMKFLF